MKVFLALVVVVALVLASAGSLWPQIVESFATSENRAITEFVGTKVITKVIDGDTVISEGESIRLLSIDTDERGYPCYTAAKARLEELVLGKEVELEADTENKDQYGRYLRYIFVNGTNVNLLVVQEGLAIARFSPENTKYKEEILAAETAARQAGIGCKWSQS